MMYPDCSKCAVCKQVKYFLDEYDDYRIHMTQANIDHVSDHARGYMHGQVSALSEILQDIADLLPHMKIERELHRQGKGM